MKTRLRATLAKTAALTFPLAVSAYLAGCGGGGGITSSSLSRQTGSLGVTVTFQSAAKGRADWSPANLPPEVEQVVVSVSGPGMLTAKTATLTPDHPSEVIVGIPVGKREVVAWGESADGTVLAGGLDRVTIVADQRASATLVMSPPAHVLTNRIAGTKQIDGVDTVVMTRDPDGEEDYFVSNASGVYYKGTLEHQQANRALIDVLFFSRPPLLVLPLGAVPGATFEQTVNEYENSLLVDQNHATLTYVGVEGVTTPAGPFTAHRLELTEEYTGVGDSAGQSQGSSFTVLWLADNVGLVALYEEHEDPNATDTELPQLSLLTGSTLLSRAGNRVTTGALGSSAFPLQQDAEWTYVDLVRHELGDVGVSSGS